MTKELPPQVKQILNSYDPTTPGATADALRGLWMQHKPKSISGIKAEQRELQETIGIPVPVLKTIGKEIGKVAPKHVDDFLPLVRLLWDDYGREGRVVTLYPLGKMELVDPEKVIPLLMEICRTCYTWEDADRLAMYGLEPIVRKQPEQWLSVIEPWLDDKNKWVRRAGVIVVGRLPMKLPLYTTRCLRLTERLLSDDDMDVKKAVSFAIRLAARGESAPVYNFLAQHVPPTDPADTWVLCDVVRSMTKKFLPEFTSLLPRYEEWAAKPELSARDRRSIESAIRKLNS